MHFNTALADTIWTNNSAYYNNFDYILTTDTTPISRIFLQNLNALNGKLIIYVSNRFVVGMKDDMEWVQLFIYATKRKDKVTIVPFCEFEKVYAAAKGVHLWEYPTIYPLGIVNIIVVSIILFYWTSLSLPRSNTLLTENSHYCGIFN